MNNKNKKRVRNQKERTAYWKNARSQNRIDPTGIYGSTNLQGSGDSSFPMDDTVYQRQNEVAPSSWRTKLKRNKEAIIKGAIGAILIPVLGFAVKWWFDTNADIQVIKYRIEAIQTTVDSLDENMTTKEVLDLKLDAIKRDVTSLIPDISGINTRLDDIESRLDTIEDETDSQSQ